MADVAYFQFYGTFKESIKKLPKRDRLDFYDKLTDYGLYGIEPEFKNPYLIIIFDQMKFAIDNQYGKNNECKRVGRKGRFSENDVQTIIASCKKGVSVKELSEKYDCSERTIYRIVNSDTDKIDTDKIDTDNSDTDKTDKTDTDNSDTDKTDKTDKNEIEIEIEKEIEVEHEMEIEHEHEHESGCVCEAQKLFLHLWRTTKDSDGMCLFQITAAIERPQDWKRFWSVSPPTCEQVKAAFKNFADGINSGAIERRFIPATPDRFALKGGLTRYQKPVVDESKKNGGGLPADRIRL